MRITVDYLLHAAEDEPAELSGSKNLRTAVAPHKRSITFQTPAVTRPYSVLHTSVTISASTQVLRMKEMIIKRLVLNEILPISSKK